MAVKAPIIKRLVRSTLFAATLVTCPWSVAQNIPLFDSNSCQNSQLLQDKVSLCKIEMRALNCDSLPPHAPKRDCVQESLSPMSSSNESIQRFAGCLKGIYGVTIGAGVSVVKSAWTDAEAQARYYSPAVYQACTQREKHVNHAIAVGKAPNANDLNVLRNCKNRLLSEFPDLQAKYSANLDHTGYDDLLDVVHQRLADIKSQQPSLAKFIRDHPSDFASALTSLATAQLQRWKIKMNCYTPEAQEELGCASVVAVIGGPGALAKVAIDIRRLITASTAVSAEAGNSTARAVSAMADTTMGTDDVLAAAHGVVDSPEVTDMFRELVNHDSAYSEMKASIIANAPSAERTQRLGQLELAHKAVRAVHASYGDLLGAEINNGDVALAILRQVSIGEPQAVIRATIEKVIKTPGLCK